MLFRSRLGSETTRAEWSGSLSESTHTRLSVGRSDLTACEWGRVSNRWTDSPSISGASSPAIVKVARVKTKRAQMPMEAQERKMEKGRKTPPRVRFSCHRYGLDPFAVGIQKRKTERQFSRYWIKDRQLQLHLLPTTGKLRHGPHQQHHGPPGFQHKLITSP